MAQTHNAPTFWKTAIIYGSLSGFFVILLMVGSYSLFGMDSNAASQTAGFLLMFFILSLIFFGIKRFRDQAQGGVIKFSKALLLGVGMSFFAGLVYVAGWEIYLAVTGTTFIDQYTEALIEMQRAKGISGEALSDFIEKMNTTKTNYANLLYRMPITFTEIFPMGFIVTLISALALHTPKFWARKV